ACSELRSSVLGAWPTLPASMPSRNIARSSRAELGARVSEHELADAARVEPAAAEIARGVADQRDVLEAEHAGDAARRLGDVADAGVDLGHPAGELGLELAELRGRGVELGVGGEEAVDLGAQRIGDRERKAVGAADLVGGEQLAQRLVARLEAGL